MDMPKSFLQRKRRSEYEDKRLKQLREEYPEDDFNADDVRIKIFKIIPSL